MSRWMEFLAVRAELLREWANEGKSAEETAQTLSMDPGQVRLILHATARVEAVGLGLDAEDGLLAAAWAERDRALEERDVARRELADATRERDVAQANWSRSVMAHEAETNRAVRAEVRAMTAEVERDRFRGVLATTRGNVEAMVRSVDGHMTEGAACSILADQRRRAREGDGG